MAALILTLALAAPLDDCLAGDAAQCVELAEQAELDHAWGLVEQSRGRGSMRRGQITHRLLRQAACEAGDRASCRPCEGDAGALPSWTCSDHGICDDEPLEERLHVCRQQGPDHPACPEGFEVLGRYPEEWVKAWVTPWGVVSPTNGAWTDGRGRVETRFTRRPFDWSSFYVEDGALHFLPLRAQVGQEAPTVRIDPDGVNLTKRVVPGGPAPEALRGRWVASSPNDAWHVVRAGAGLQLLDRDLHEVFSASVRTSRATVTNDGVVAASGWILGPPGARWAPRPPPDVDVKAAFGPTWKGPWNRTATLKGGTVLNDARVTIEGLDGTVCATLRTDADGVFTYDHPGDGCADRVVVHTEAGPAWTLFHPIDGHGDGSLRLREPARRSFDRKVTAIWQNSQGHEMSWKGKELVDGATEGRTRIRAKDGRWLHNGAWTPPWRLELTTCDGAPAAGVEVRYRRLDQTRVTDDEGRVELRMGGDHTVVPVALAVDGRLRNAESTQDDATYTVHATLWCDVELPQETSLQRSVAEHLELDGVAGRISLPYGTQASTAFAHDGQWVEARLRVDGDGPANLGLRVRPASRTTLTDADDQPVPGLRVSMDDPRRTDLRGIAWGPPGEDHEVGLPVLEWEHAVATAGHDWSEAWLPGLGEKPVPLQRMQELRLKPRVPYHAVPFDPDALREQVIAADPFPVVLYEGGTVQPLPPPTTLGTCRPERCPTPTPREPAPDALHRGDPSGDWLRARDWASQQETWTLPPGETPDERWARLKDLPPRDRFLRSRRAMPRTRSRPKPLDPEACPLYIDGDTAVVGDEVYRRVVSD